MDSKKGNQLRPLHNTKWRIWTRKALPRLRVWVICIWIWNIDSTAVNSMKITPVTPQAWKPAFKVDPLCPVTQTAMNSTGQSLLVQTTQMTVAVWRLGCVLAPDARMDNQTTFNSIFPVIQSPGTNRLTWLVSHTTENFSEVMETLTLFKDFYFDTLFWKTPKAWCSRAWLRLETGEQHFFVFKMLFFFFFFTPKYVIDIFK